MLTSNQIYDAREFCNKIFDHYRDNPERLASFGVIRFYDYIHENADDSQSEEKDVEIIIEYFIAEVYAIQAAIDFDEYKITNSEKIARDARRREAVRAFARLYNNRFRAEYGAIK